jgi:hypothetical protein
MKHKVSNIISKNDFNSKAYNDLSPLMKEAVNDVFKIVKNEGNIIVNFENAVNKIAEFHKVDEKRLYDYFDNEVNEQLGLNETPPDTSDAMKRYKAGKAGFGDITHLKAKGLIPRSDGKKRVSDKYK